MQQKYIYPWNRSSTENVKGRVFIRIKKQLFVILMGDRTSIIEILDSRGPLNGR
jgi:hypothetical protein